MKPLAILLLLPLSGAALADDAANSTTTNLTTIDTTVAATVVTVPTTAATEAKASTDQDGDGLDGKHEIGVSLGRSRNLSHSRTNLRSTHVAVEYSYFQSDKAQWAIEADFQRTTFPRQDNTFGLLALYRYHLRSHGKVRPFLQAGAGIIRTSLDVPEISGHLQFQEKVGGGVRYQLKKSLYLLGEVNFYHVSNADLQDRNRGFNDIHYAVGLHQTF